MSETILKLLNDLDNTRCQVDALRLGKQQLIDSVITDEIKAKLADIDAEVDPEIKRIEDTVRALENTIKEETVFHGSSVESENLKVIFYKGRKSWDGKLLEGFALAHPEVLACQKIGDPYASIRNK